MKKFSLLVPFTAIVLLAACGDDTPTTPTLPLAEVQGIYDLSVLTFDPQGSLAAADIAAELQSALGPQLNLARNGTAQLLFRDPASGEVETVNGGYTTTQTAVRLSFDAGSGYDIALLPRQFLLQFAQDSTGAARLTFSDTTSVSRAQLVALVPEYANEQLFDPTPGKLTVVFTK